jgi:hypothetical protein
MRETGFNPQHHNKKMINSLKEESNKRTVTKKDHICRSKMG